MTTFRATVSIDIERPDGSKSTVTETVTQRAGDNPRFDASSSLETIDRAVSEVLGRLGSRVDA